MYRRKSMRLVIPSNPKGRASMLVTSILTYLLVSQSLYRDDAQLAAALVGQWKGHSRDSGGRYTWCSDFKPDGALTIYFSYPDDSDDNAYKLVGKWWVKDRRYVSKTRDRDDEGYRIEPYLILSVSDDKFVYQGARYGSERVFASSRIDDCQRWYERVIR